MLTAGRGQEALELRQQLPMLGQVIEDALR